jgi:O-antigen/teichoic acid export membrane protein
MDLRNSYLVNASIISGGFWLFFAQAISASSAFVVTILLAHNLPQEVFGQYRFILSVIPILSIWTLPGIGMALTRSVAAGNSINLTTIAKAKVRWGLGGSLMAASIATYYYLQGDTILMSLFVISALCIPLYETFFVYSYYYKGIHDFKTPAIYESISKVIQALLLIIAFLLTQNVLLLVTMFFLGQILTRYFFYRKTVEKIGTSNESHDDTIEYGKHLSVMNIVSIITNNIDKLFVWYFFGAYGLAAYIVVLLLPLHIYQFLGLGNQLAFTRLSQRNYSPEGGSLNLKKYLMPMLLLLSFVTIVMTPLLLWAFSLLFNTYKEFSHLLLLATPLMLLLPLKDLSFSLLISQKHQSYISYSLLLSFLLYLLLLVFLPSSLDTFLIALLCKELASILLSYLYILKLKLTS